MNQISAKYCAIISTTAYAILLPILTWMALFWSASSDPSKVLDFFIVFTWFWTPISILFSIYLMWSKYRIGHYKNVLIFCSLPLLAFSVFLVVNLLVR